MKTNISELTKGRSQLMSVTPLTVAEFIGCWIVALWLRLSHVHQVLFIVMFLDQISAMIAAGMRKELSSSRGWQGLKKKAMMWILIGAVGVADQLIAKDFQISSALALYFIVNETLSVVENSALCGVPVPEWLTTRLEALREEDPKEDSKVAPQD